MSDFVEVTDDALDLSEISKLVTAPTTGATSLFVGTTRDHFEGKAVVHLEYEAYKPMAKKEMLKVCQKIRSKWSGIHNIAIYHRLGHVAVTEASVVVAVSSEHRKESLEAVQFAIDDLKANVPIWKKEFYADKKSQWKQNKECHWSPKEVEINKDDVLLNISFEELNRRMEAFMERKRDEINNANVMEYCNRHISEEPNYSCARVDAVPLMRHSQKSHMRYTKVVNPCGPQTDTYMDRRHNPLIQFMAKPKEEQAGDQTDAVNDDIPEGIRERIHNLEKKVGVAKPVPKDMYARIKNLEDRVLHLEGVSPEYFSPSVMGAGGSRADTNERALKAINSRIQELQSSLSANPQPMEG